MKKQKSGSEITGNSKRTQHGHKMVYSTSLHTSPTRGPTAIQRGLIKKATRNFVARNHHNVNSAQEMPTIANLTPIQGQGCPGSGSNGENKIIQGQGGPETAKYISQAENSLPQFLKKVNKNPSA